MIEKVLPNPELAKRVMQVYSSVWISITPAATGKLDFCLLVNLIEKRCLACVDLFSVNYKSQTKGTYLPVERIVA